MAEDAEFHELNKLFPMVPPRLDGSIYSPQPPLLAGGGIPSSSRVLTSSRPLHWNGIAGRVGIDFLSHPAVGEQAEEGVSGATDWNQSG